MSMDYIEPSPVGAGVDAAPTEAVVGIAAQSVRLVNVVGVAEGIARVPENPGHLAGGERFAYCIVKTGML